MSTRRALLGRADLLRASPAGDDALQAALASHLGYEARQPTPEADTDERGNDPVRTSDADAAASSTRHSSQSRPQPPRPVPLWQQVACEATHQADGPAPAVAQTGLPVWRQRPGQLPRAAELTRWSDLLPRLRRELGAACAGPKVDIPALIHRLARGHQLDRVPRRRRRRWGSQVHIIEDRSQHLTPYWDDQRRLAGRLSRLLPGYALSHGLCLEGDLAAPPLDRFRQPPLPGSLVLVLGDLGLLAPRGSPAPAWWQRLGRQLAADGCRLLALTPAAPSLYPAVSHHYWRLLSWERGSASSDEQARERQLQRLLTLATIASRIEPGLLRGLRRLIRADSAVEAEFWRHPALIGDSSEGATPAPGEVRRRRAALAGEDPGIRRQALALLRDWRAGLPDEIWFIELQNLSPSERALLPDARDLAQSRDFITALGHQARGVDGSEPVAGAISWFEDMAPFLPPDYLDDKELGHHFNALWGRVYQHNPQARLPDGLQPAEVPAPPLARPERVVVWQHGRVLAATAIGPGNPALGSPLGELPSANGVLRIEQTGRQPRTLPVSGADPAGIALPRPAAFSVISDHQTLRFERLSLGHPDLGWASALGRDRYGLWAEIRIEPERGPGRPGRPGRPVTQRLRWMPPGRFEMGSPSEEPGRYEDEGPLHQVTLDQGFWLFDTPVTQALWEAVMGDNPSRFQSPDRPVERVDWDASLAFIKAINQRLPGLDLSLPSEAQWEYACRAGTRGALYTGPIAMRGDWDAPALDEIAWYGGNSAEGFTLDNGTDLSEIYSDKSAPSGKAGTHPVAQKAANAWGLYDMLGTVWEWTADAWQASYEGAPADGSARPGQPDQPDQPDQPGARRVVRGGSWYDSARFVRCAVRGGYDPVVRDGELGLRCARVQVRS